MTHTLPKNVNYKIVFFALLEAAMRYREGYWRDEQEEFEKDSLAIFEENAKGLNFSQYKKKHNATLGIIGDREVAQLKFNKAMYDELENLTKTYSPSGKVAFDNYATAYGLVAEYLQKAKNTTEFLTICQLYNSGTFDKDLQEAIQRGKTEELNNKYENKDENKINSSADSGNSGSDNGDNRSDQLQEEQSITINHDHHIGSPTERSHHGHNDRGELQDDPINT